MNLFSHSEINTGRQAAVDMAKFFALWLLVGIGVIITAPTSCYQDGSEKQAYSGVPLIILDTDIGSSTDDLFALEMLYRYEQEGRCRLLGLIVDREGEDCAALADVMNTYFGHANTPIGLIKEGIPKPAVWIDYKALPTYKTADVGTRCIAAAAADTFLPVHLGIDNRVAVQVMRQVELGQEFSHQIGQIANAAPSHIVLQAQDHVVNDAVAILHHGGAHRDCLGRST